jgi:hypothetical protein
MPDTPPSKKLWDRAAWRDAGFFLRVRAEDILGVVVDLLGFGGQQAEGQQAREDTEELHGGVRYETRPPEDTSPRRSVGGL